MPNNQFVPFGTGANANTMDPASYAASPTVQSGVGPGEASSELANTTWRQSSTVAAMIGLFITTNAGVDALDNGNVSQLEASFEAGLRNISTTASQQVQNAIRAAGLTYNSGDLTQLAIAEGRGIWVGALGGTGDLPTATLGIVVASLPQGTRLRGVATANNTISSPKLRVLNIGTSGAYIDFPIFKENGTLLSPGELISGRTYTFTADGNSNVQVSGGGLTTSLVVPSANPTLYVRTDGSDTGATSDGSANDATHAFATVQAAMNAAITKYAVAGRTIIIQLGNAGTYTIPPTIPTGTTFQINGDPSNPGNYTLAGTGTAASAGVLQVQQATLLLTGVQIRNNSSAINTVAALYGGNVSLFNCYVIHGGTNTGSDLVAFPGGSITVSGTIYFGNSAASAVNAFGGNISFQSNTVISIQTTNAYSVATVQASNSGGSVSFNSNVSFQSSNPSGSRFAAFINGSINTFGSGVNFIPGSSAGTTSTGGQYA